MVSSLRGLETLTSPGAPPCKAPMHLPALLMYSRLLFQLIQPHHIHLDTLDRAARPSSVNEYRCMEVMQRRPFLLHSLICGSQVQRLTAEEDPMPPAIAEQEVALQPKNTKKEQCNGQGQANGLPNGKPAPARPLSFNGQGSSSSVNNQQMRNGRSSPSRNGRTSPPLSAKVNESMHLTRLTGLILQCR